MYEACLTIMERAVCYEKVPIHQGNIEEKNWWGRFEEVSSPSTYFQSY